MLFSELAIDDYRVTAAELVAKLAAVSSPIGMRLSLAHDRFHASSSLHPSGCELGES
jgi:hypothetical protein